ENPYLTLQTTYKPRCHFGLTSKDPDSPSSCHKPARGALSKYCSDECGIKCMPIRTQKWAASGKVMERLWESVKGVERREGVV
ncbi:uncharacterized protein STEHIDRAFT_40043, partial [Stereum hirsutum FP-91666 SS1]|uniref:uncharacterized protein n=1 Tax=Stereum hirsutum (strain FP-91666) TaxID=721885 RepID=UPI00044495C2